MIKNFKSIKRAVFSVTVMALAFSLGAAAPAEAKANPYTPQEVCGKGYSVQRSHGLKGAIVYQLYNGSSTCVVTIKTSSIGTPTRTTAGLQVSGSDWAYDTGNYKYYAGPVKQPSKGKCVRFFGYHDGTNYTSPWGNCK